MGRLTYLQKSFPAFPKPCVVVDYSCPEGSGDWAEERWAIVVRVQGETYFHKTRALNLGARRAIALGATRLAFLDADTLVRPGFKEFAESKATSLICPPGNPSLVGVLVTPVVDFVKAQGYNEDYRGWGCEDLDMRLRLHFAGSVFETIPTEMLDSTPHGKGLRTQYYEVKNQMVSRATNAILLERNIRAVTGKSPRELDDVAKQLLRVV